MEADRRNLPPDPFSTELTGRLLSKRTLLINGPITQAAAARVSEQLMVLAADADATVRVLLHAPGGAFEAGFALHDLMRSVQPRIKIVASGQVAGAGVLVFIAAEVQDRYSLPNAHFRLDRPSGEPRLAPADLASEAGHVADLRQRTARLLAHATGQPLETVRRDLRHGRRLAAEEAVRYGLASRVIERTDEIE